MTIIISAGDSSSPGLVAFLLILGGVYLVSLRLFPEAKCGLCQASGKLFSPTGDHARPCPKCRGAKWQTRWGRRILSAVLGGRRR